MCSPQNCANKLCPAYEIDFVEDQIQGKREMVIRKHNCRELFAAYLCIFEFYTMCILY